MHYLITFLVGGALCAIAEVFMTKTKLTPARVLVGLVTLGVLLSAIGIYKPFVEFAGAGATVPLLGFGHLLAQGVIEAAAQEGWLGVLSGGTAATAGGIAAAIFFGYLAALFFNPKMKP